MPAADDLALLRKMADAVARVVRETPPERFGETIGMGADGTATKLVDSLAEQAILQVMDAEEADLDLLSEEAGRVDRGGARVLVADPIDGTTNAVRGIPFYCVSLAIGRERISDVDAGLVMNLCTGERYEAARGEGATRDGRPIRVRAPAKSIVVSVGTPPARGRKGLPRIASTRSFGATALEMALVAQGALDGYRHDKSVLRVIDVAAADLIVREAGGFVLDDAGERFDLPLSLEPRFGLTAAAHGDVARAMGVEPK